MRVRVAAASAALAGVAVVAVVAAAPPLKFAYSSPGLHVAVETTIVAIGGAVALVSFGRFRARRDPADLAVAGAVVVLAVANLAFADLPEALAGPSRFSAWAPVGARLAASGLLAWAALAIGRVAAPAHVPILARPGRPGRGPGPPAVAVAERAARRPVGVLPARTVAAWLCGVAGPLALAGVVGGITAGWLPAGSPGVATGGARLAPASNPLALAALVLVATLFAVAAAVLAGRADHDRDDFAGWLACGSALAAAASVGYLLFRVPPAGTFHAGDVLEVGAFVCWLVGAAREIARAQAAAAVEDERRRIARHLHDGVAQELAFIVARTSGAARGRIEPAALPPVAAAARRALYESRQAIAALRAPVDDPLERALAEAAGEVAGRYGMELHLHVEDGLRVAPDVRETLGWIVREAVTNAGRHGRAGHVHVDVGKGRPLRVTVRDDGVGLDPDGHGVGFGLTGMRERAASIGGSLSVRSSPGRGTTVAVE